MPNPDTEKATKPIDRLTGSYTPSPLPFDSPDGSAIGAPLASSTLPEPMCRRGPCRHYHEIEVQVDEAEPLAGALEHRSVQTHASCYAHVGVETELSLDAPVIRCNRWSPLLRIEIGRRDERIKRFEEEEEEEKDARAGLSIAQWPPSNIDPEDVEDILGTESIDINPEGDATP